MAKEISELKMEYRQDINTSSHALLNKVLADFRRISRTLRQ